MKTLFTALRRSIARQVEGTFMTLAADARRGLIALAIVALAGGVSSCVVPTQVQGIGVEYNAAVAGDGRVIRGVESFTCCETRLGKGGPLSFQR